MNRSTSQPRRIDMHVHMVGNGVAGSGGWLRLSGWHRWLAGFMIRQLGFPAAVLKQDLESVYAQHLLELVRASSFDAVVLLAHERVHDPDGTVREDLGSMYVPNDVVLDLAARHPEFLAGVSHSSGAAGCDGGTGALSGARCGSDEVPAELSEHRLLGRALSAVLGTDGGGAAAVARAYRRRKYGAGGERARWRIRSCCACRWSAA